MSLSLLTRMRVRLGITLADLGRWDNTYLNSQAALVRAVFIMAISFYVLIAIHESAHWLSALTFLHEGWLIFPQSVGPLRTIIDGPDPPSFGRVVTWCAGPYVQSMLIAYLLLRYRKPPQFLGLVILGAAFLGHFLWAAQISYTTATTPVVEWSAADDLPKAASAIGGVTAITGAALFVPVIVTAIWAGFRFWRWHLELGFKWASTFAVSALYFFVLVITLLFMFAAAGEIQETLRSDFKQLSGSK